MGLHSVICHPTEVTAPPMHTGLQYSVVNRTSREVMWTNKAATDGVEPSTHGGVRRRCSHKTTTKCLWRARRKTPETEVKPPGHNPLGHTPYSTAVGHCRTEPGGYYCWKLTPTRTPDPIRLTRRGPDPNRPTNGRKQGGLWPRGVCPGSFGRTPPETIGDSRTEFNRILYASKSEAAVTSNKKLRCRYVEADYRQTRSIARPLCDSWASCTKRLPGLSRMSYPDRLKCLIVYLVRNYDVFALIWFIVIKYCYCWCTGYWFLSVGPIHRLKLYQNRSSALVRSSFFSERVVNSWIA